MLGDFNVIKDLSETNIDNDSWDIGMEEFKSCTISVGVVDIRGLVPCLLGLTVLTAGAQKTASCYGKL